MPVPNLNMTILFVKSPEESAKFYSKLLGVQPLEVAKTFAMFKLPNGAELGLWSKETAEPKVEAQPGSSEIAFSDDAVDDVYARFQKLGAEILQKPTDMDFGRTFVALDPDGHRIRVYKVFERDA